MAADARSTALTEGELWVREQLAELLHRRFSPSAVGRFLAASQRRANEVRRRRPQVAAQARWWSLTGAAAWLALASAGRQPYRSRLAAGLGWWGLTCLMVDWHLGMVETEDGRPRPLGPADALTLARVWVAPALVDRPTLGLATAGFATDVLDGAAARALGEPTRAGRDLEGLADACFAAALLIGLRRREAIGALASAAELSRLGAGFALSAATYFGRARPPDRNLMAAARPTAVARAAGLLAAAMGRRRLADALVGAGCAWSVALLARATRGAL